MVQRMEVSQSHHMPMMRDYSIDDMLVNAVPVKGLDGFLLYDQIAEDDIELVWSETGIVDSRGKIVAYATWRHLLWTDSAKVITPAMVSVLPRYRGKNYNLAITIYKYVLHTGYIIQAGDIKNVQSKGGFSLWLRMLENPSIAIYAQHHPLTQPLEITSESMLKDCVGNDTVLLMRHRNPRYA